MYLTDQQAKYLAHELTKRCSSDSLEKLAGAVASAQVDLNPHQIDAALFAFASPFSRGAILADEVGLGKTIEAGLVLAQRWAERRRRVLVIAPSNLRKQWHQELTEKFFLPCRILEAKSYNGAQQLSEEVGDERTLLVLCTSFRGRGEGYPNLTVKKIPKAVLSCCEWGKDDYSLRVESLAPAEPEPGQMEMEL